MSKIVLWNGTYEPITIDSNGYACIYKTDDWEGIYFDLMQRLITSNSPCMFSELQRQEDLVREMYYSIAENCLIVPELQEVVAAVEEYNREVIAKIAEVDFANNMAHRYDNLTVYELNNIMMELCQNWYNDLYFEYFNDIEIWVQELLDKTRNAYIITGGRYYNYWPTNEYLMIKNDCQNIINPEWIVKGMKSSVDEKLVDLDKVQVVSYL